MSCNQSVLYTDIDFQCIVYCVHLLFFIQLYASKVTYKPKERAGYLWKFYFVTYTIIYAMIHVITVK